VKATELLKRLRRAMDESDEMPLTEAEQRFYTDVHLAVMAYEDHVQLGHPVAERPCMNCELPLSQCCC
jgi:hypothetical protein